MKQKTSLNRTIQLWIFVLLSTFFFTPVFAQVNPGQNAMTMLAPSTKESPGASPAASVSELPTPSHLLTPNEKKTLLREFRNALSTEEKALSHRERAETKQFTAAENAKIKSWRESEKAARKKYFENHMSGPERRDYVQKYLRKKETFDAATAEEVTAAKKEWKLRHEQLSKTQKENEALFQKSLDQNLRPDPAIWPKSQ